LKAFADKVQFWCAITSSEYLHVGQFRVSRSSGQGQGHRCKSVSVYLVCGWSAFDSKAILVSPVVMIYFVIYVVWPPGETTPSETKA